MCVSQKINVWCVSNLAGNPQFASIARHCCWHRLQQEQIQSRNKGISIYIYTYIYFCPCDCRVHMFLYSSCKMHPLVRQHTTRSKIMPSKQVMQKPKLPDKPHDVAVSPHQDRAAKGRRCSRGQTNPRDAGSPLDLALLTA
jgi:hypothetical protein